MFGVRSPDLVPRYFDIPAEIPLDDEKRNPNNADGPFVLGTFLESLADPFKALNGGAHRVEIPAGHAYTHVRGLQTFEFSTRYAAGHDTPEIRFDCSTSSQLNVVCDRVETRYFNPKFFGRDMKQAELYMITGIKVAYGVRATATTELNLASIFGSDAKEFEHEIMPKMENAVILSYRANKYTLFRPSLLNRWQSRYLKHNGWMIRSEPILVGDDYATAIKKFKERNGPIWHLSEQQAQ
ncbi:unnamed protein product [Clonostachys byssicola]|uniref:Uncharacterized protein n=1 Tax=Clonostachys byssicola TaxID=160290 RepID=A0A9N9U795_9HYPO|nr:unnamed protein product [Clonostachys byssicola]